jgi:hypothetical protein
MNLYCVQKNFIVSPYPERIASKPYHYTLAWKSLFEYCVSVYAKVINSAFFSWGFLLKCLSLPPPKPWSNWWRIGSRSEGPSRHGLNHWRIRIK